jgi:ABC-type antimicrobial peptide transport system permease subunit
LNIRDQIAVALDELKAHPFRAFLTSLGLVMGVGSVLGIISIGDGAKAEADRQVQMMGSNQIFVRYREPEKDDKQNQALSKGLTTEDVKAIGKIPGVIAASPETRGWGIMRFADYTFEGNCVIVEPDYAEVRERRVKRGRFISEHDIITAAKVCVLRKEAPPEEHQWWRRPDPIAKVFEMGDPIGKSLLIMGVPYQVIGVIEEERPPEKQLVNIYWGGWREVVYVPSTSYSLRQEFQDTYYSIAVKAASVELVDRVVEDISQLLLHRHKGTKDFQVNSMKEMLDQIFKVLGMFNMVFGLLAGAGLLVGGIGIMNIMLASLNERVREIGLRKSVGAKNRDILIQFLTEAVLLCGLGGLVGIPLGIGASLVVSRFTGWTTVVNPQSILIALFYAVLVGVVFGIYPAYRAAQLSPIDALRNV